MTKRMKQNTRTIKTVIYGTGAWVLHVALFSFHMKTITLVGLIANWSVRPTFPDQHSNSPSSISGHVPYSSFHLFALLMERWSFFVIKYKSYKPSHCCCCLFPKPPFHVLVQNSKHHSIGAPASFVVMDRCLQGFCTADWSCQPANPRAFLLIERF